MPQCCQFVVAWRTHLNSNATYVVDALPAAQAPPAAIAVEAALLASHTGVPTGVEKRGDQQRVKDGERQKAAGGGPGSGAGQIRDPSPDRSSSRVILDR